MSTMILSLPDDLKAFVDEQVSTRRYANGSEYIHELIKRDRERQTLRMLLIEGAGSPQTGIVDNDYFEALRTRARSSGSK